MILLIQVPSQRPRNTNPGLRSAVLNPGSTATLTSPSMVSISELISFYANSYEARLSPRNPRTAFFFSVFFFHKTLKLKPVMFFDKGFRLHD